MEIEFKGNEIAIDKDQNQIDDLAIDFCKHLNKLNIKYVIISGYEAILFGRNRASEDVDMFLEKLDKERFGLLWKSLIDDGFWCINGEFEEAFSLLHDGLPPRFARSGEVYPNMEVKTANSDLDFYSLKNRIKLALNRNEIYIGPIELNIAFKLGLGSNKDIEDARFLYKLLCEHLDKEKLLYFVRLLKVEDKAKEFIWMS